MLALSYTWICYTTTKHKTICMPQLHAELQRTTFAPSTSGTRSEHLAHRPVYIAGLDTNTQLLYIVGHYDNLHPRHSTTG